MYADAKRIRINRVTVRLDEYENNLVRALADYQGEQPSVLIRQLLIKEAASVLPGGESVEQQRQK